ncbi:MAG TPA: hypothetical protein VJB60_01890 [Candidatus Peribacterales bacterium]|nr:hypothetical protein [Candidatus Peribacterales bacterium]
MSDAADSPEEFAGASPFVSSKIGGGEILVPEQAADIVILLVRHEESLAKLGARLEEPLTLVRGGKKLLIVFPRGWEQQASVRARQEFLTAIKAYAEHIIIAAHERVLLLNAKNYEFTVLQSSAALRLLLKGHPHAGMALRHYASSRWQEEFWSFVDKLRSLSVHRVSVISFLALSIGLFGTVLFIAIPSARIRIWPSVNLVSHTANVVLVASGTILDFDPKYTLPLLTLRTSVQRSLTFTEISKKFLGENAETEMTMINETDETYYLRSGTRLVNQAGMIFRTLETVEIPPATPVESGVIRVQAQAAPEDLYGQIIGERGNVPAGIKWEIPGLPLEERALVYARNQLEATGGVTRYGQELQEKDLELAQKQLEQELMTETKRRTEEEISVRSSRDGHTYVVLQYDVLTGLSFSGFVLPTNLIGQELTSIPVSGGLTYTALAYSKDALLALLLPRLLEHVEEGRELIPNSAVMDGISVHVIEYDDNLFWVKITAELTGKQRSILRPVTALGRGFSERVREMVRGVSISEAERIIQNFPEVERVQISVWPPWRGSIPSLMSNIVILPQDQ